MSREIGKINKPLFICVNQTELTYLQNMTRDISADRITLFKPEKGKAIRGTKALDQRGGFRG